MFSVVVDGTSDITHREQKAISVKYVDADLKVEELFMGFYNLDSGTDGQSVANMVLDVLLRLGLPITQLRGQTYDGASNMAGQYNGAQAIVHWQFCALFDAAGNLAVQEAVEADMQCPTSTSWV